MANKVVVSGVLNKKIGAMVSPEIRRITREIVEDAKERAPKDKVWVRDPAVDTRDEHLEANGQTVPTNLRYTLRTPDYDRAHYIDKEFQMGPEPKVFDPDGVNGFTSGLVANCHCTSDLLPTSSLAEKIEATIEVLPDNRVRATVTCDHDYAEAAEFGNSIDDGAHFLGGALREAARRLGVKRISSR